MTTNQARAKKLFEKNTVQPAVYFTTDGQPFFNKEQAEGHASRFDADKRGIETITREEAADLEEETETTAPAAKGPKGKGKKAKAGETTGDGTKEEPAATEEANTGTEEV